MNVGDPIKHRKLGRGTITSIITRGGRRGAEIDFGYMSEWIPFDEIGVDGQGGSKVSINVPTAAAEDIGPDGGCETMPDDVVAARRGVLALKLGQIREEHVLELSTGTDALRCDLERTVSDVARRQARKVLFKGSYGAGKTHLLTMLSALAATEGLATASVILDGEGVVLSEPMSLMEALLATLRYPGEAVPLGISHRAASLRRANRRSEVYERLGARLADALFEVPVRAFDEPEVVDLLEEYLSLSLPANQARQRLRVLGHGSIALPPMKARSIGERSERFCELLRGWTEFCVLTGAKGLLLVFDEVDVEYGSTIWRRDLRLRRTKLLEALGSMVEQKVPLLLAFASAPTGDGVAVEDDAVVDLVRHLGGVDLEVEVPQPTAGQMKQLARQILSLYERAYPERMACVDRARMTRLLDTFAERHQRAINPVPRHFVRGALERLDVASRLPLYEVQK